MAKIIRVIDFETTGMEPPAEVCEIGFCDVERVGADLIVGEPHARLCAVQAMPPEIRAVHHITLAETVGQPPFRREAVIDAAAHCLAIAAHNLEFEQRFLQNDQLPMLCTYKAALRVWPDAPSHSNGVLRYWLEDQGLLSLDHETAMPPHRAGPDAYVTAHILKALVNAGATVSQMVKWTAEPRLLPKCTLGKFRGTPWPEVDIGFLQWMLNQSTMEEDLKWNARREIERRTTAA